MMSKFVIRDFEERIFELERKVDALTKGRREPGLQKPKQRRREVTGIWRA